MTDGGEEFPLDTLDPDRGEGDDEHETSSGGWTRDSEKYKFPERRHDNPAYDPDELADEETQLIDKVEGDKEVGEAFSREKFVNRNFRNLVCGLDDNGRY